MIEELPQGPTWPDTQPGHPARVLFLLDAASDFDERVLREWISSNRPDSALESDIHAVRIPSSRRPQIGMKREGELEAALTDSGDILVSPLRVAWLAPEKEGRREATYSDLVSFGDPRDPGQWRARWVRRFSPDRCAIVAGEPATATTLRDRWRAAMGAADARALPVRRDGD